LDEEDLCDYEYQLFRRSSFCLSRLSSRFKCRTPISLPCDTVQNISFRVSDEHQNVRVAVAVVMEFLSTESVVTIPPQQQSSLWEKLSNHWCENSETISNFSWSGDTQVAKSFTGVPADECHIVHAPVGGGGIPNRRNRNYIHFDMWKQVDLFQQYAGFNGNQIKCSVP
jgi:hypothetical protein